MDIQVLEIKVQMQFQVAKNQKKLEVLFLMLLEKHFLSMYLLEDLKFF